MHAIRVVIAIPPLFAVRNKRQACGFKPLNGISNRNFIERSGVGILTVVLCDALDEINGPEILLIGLVVIVMGACLAILTALRQEI